MLSELALVILLLVAPAPGQSVPSPCRCSALWPEALLISCGSRDLTELPWLPPGTVELYLQDNRLTGVAPGSFDALRGLRRLNLTGNPFHCGCAIRYLSVWLQDHGDMSVGNPTCASPASLAPRSVAGLDPAHFSACGGKRGASVTLDAVAVPTLAVFVLLLLWCLGTTRRSAFTLEVFAHHAGFEAHALQSLKPKHKRDKRHAVSSEEGELKLEHADECNVEAPLINMEILPQILDILQKKHNMKFKTP